jgi:hypothetical protein
VTGEIFTLPIRLTARTASLLLRGSAEVATRGIALATHAVNLVRPPSESPPSPPASEEEHSQPERREPEPQEAPPPPIEHEDVIDFDAPPESEPLHVSEEPVLAAEVAERGAEEGAGAQIRVDEPWPGYRELHADDIVARINTAGAAELAAIQLYESAHKRRETVLSAVGRQLELTNRGGPTN